MHVQPKGGTTTNSLPLVLAVKGFAIGFSIFYIGYMPRYHIFNPIIDGSLEQLRPFKPKSSCI